MAQGIIQGAVEPWQSVMRESAQAGRDLLEQLDATLHELSTLYPYQHSQSLNFGWLFELSYALKKIDLYSRAPLNLAAVFALTGARLTPEKESPDSDDERREQTHEHPILYGGAAGEIEDVALEIRNFVAKRMEGWGCSLDEGLLLHRLGSIADNLNQQVAQPVLACMEVEAGKFGEGGRVPDNTAITYSEQQRVLKKIGIIIYSAAQLSGHMREALADYPQLGQSVDGDAIHKLAHRVRDKMLELEAAVLLEPSRGKLLRLAGKGGLIEQVGALALEMQEHQVANDSTSFGEREAVNVINGRILDIGQSLADLQQPLVDYVAYEKKALSALPGDAYVEPDGWAKRLAQRLGFAALRPESQNGIS